MSCKELALIAHRDAARSEQLQKSRQSRSSLAFLKYLFWRNRYPVLTKVFSKLVIVVEVALLLHYFHTDLARNMSFLLYLLFVMGVSLQGIIQGGRIWQVQHSHLTVNQRRRAIGAVTLLIIGASWGALSAILLGVFLASGSYELWVLAIGFILVPLELLESQLWSLVYTQQRLARSFSLVMTLRMLPAFMIIAFHNTLGASSYAIGIVLSRLLESAYLIALANHTLVSRSSTPLIDRESFRMIKAFVGDPIFRRYCLTPLSIQFYQLALAALIFSYRPYLWMTFFWFQQALQLALFISLRPSYSLAMDIFIATSRGALRNGSRLLRLGLRYSWLAALTVSIFLGSLSASFPIYLTLVIPEIWQVLPWLLVSLLARTFLQTRFLFHKNVGSEIRNFGLIFPLMVVCAPTIQYFITEELLGNLPLIILVDSLLCLAAGVLLGPIRLNDSPVHSAVLREEVKRNVAEPASEVARRLKAPGAFEAFALFATSPYLSKQQLTVLLRLVKTSYTPSGMLLCIVPGLYCLFHNRGPNDVLHSMSDPNLPTFAGHQIATFSQPLNAPFMGREFRDFISRLNKSRHLTRSLRGLLERLNRHLASGYLRRIFAIVSQLEESKLKTTHASIEAITREVLGYTPAILEISESGERLLGSPQDKRALFDAGDYLDTEFQATVIPTNRRGDYPIFMAIDRPVTIVDVSTASDVNREKIRDLAVAFALLSVVSTVSKAYPAFGASLVHQIASSN